MKVVINTCHGGFGLSMEAIEMYSELKKIDEELFNDRDVSRHDEYLVKVVEELGKKANDRFSNLKVVEIPDGTDYVIQEYDGSEWIAEKHKTWD